MCMERQQIPKIFHPLNNLKDFLHKTCRNNFNVHFVNVSTNKNFIAKKSDCVF